MLRIFIEELLLLQLIKIKFYCKQHKMSSELSEVRR